MSTQAYELVVVIPFGDYKRGDVITDSAFIAEILDPENPKHEHEPNVRRRAVEE